MCSSKKVLKLCTDEKECACKVGYKYIAQNLMGEEEKKEHHALITQKYAIKAGYAVTCDCSRFEFKKTNNVINTQVGDLRVACPPNGNTFCVNNPWDRNKFAIENGKLYLDKNNRLRALTRLDKGEMIGEFRGVLQQPDGISSEAFRGQYSFFVPHIRKTIVATNAGSAMRLIRNGCKPNCMPLVFIHNFTFKVVFLTLKAISAEQELFLRHDVKYPSTEHLPVCCCGRHNCKRTLGNYKNYYYEGTGLVMPIPISLKEYSIDVRNFLETPCTRNVYNASYTESHVHELFDTVAAVLLLGDELVVVTARVTCVTKSQAGFFYYTVVRSGNPLITSILPMWAVFKHVETAEWVLGNVYSTVDEKHLTDFLRSATHVKDVNKHTKEILPDYVDKLFKNRIPTPTWRYKADFEGSSVVFSNDTKLESDTDTQKTVASFDGRITTAEYTSRHNSVDSILTAITTYTPQVMFARIVEHTVESLAILYLSRIDSDNETAQKVTYNEAYNLMKTEITRQYYAENPKDRQFLLYEHYRVAIEVEIPGSNHWNWCSLCTPEETFAGDIPMNQHFHERHAMIARKYACCKRTCKFETNYPSEYRYHVKNCTPQFKQMLGCDKEPTIIDSYADYIALREKSGHLLYLIKPGLPTCYGFSKQQPNTQGKLDQSQGETKKFWGPNKPRGPNDTPKKPNIKWRYAEPHQMDVLNKRPVDESIKRVAANFKLQKSFQTLQDKRLLTFVNKPRYVTRLKVVRVADDVEPNNASSTRNNTKLPQQDTQQQFQVLETNIATRLRSRAKTNKFGGNQDLIARKRMKLENAQSAYRENETNEISESSSGDSSGDNYSDVDI